ncbi:Hypothetical protein NTJ_07386 [Nesidiocoris tenuis]|uniref:Uncharacterized protein n=1 Tax=Nesidiocoris tenuis TaxID=355587 RepID=A0ABN7ATB5_9HEMI|nr:Hypothetical protein NTJ_07386 [Nesidiocoris tenuis]
MWYANTLSVDGRELECERSSKKVKTSVVNVCKKERVYSMRDVEREESGLRARNMARHSWTDSQGLGLPIFCFWPAQVILSFSVETHGDHSSSRAEEEVAVLLYRHPNIEYKFNVRLIIC